MKEDNEFRIRLSLVFSFCLVCEVAFVLLDLFVNWLRWTDAKPVRRLFNITREDGIASLFAVIQSAVIALVCWAIYVTHSRARATKTFVSIGWLFVAVLFTYLTIDDGAMVHERVGTVYKNANEGVVLSSYGWQILLAPVFVLLGAVLFFFLWFSGGNDIHRRWLLIALGCLGVAMAIDYFEGTKWGFQWVSENTGYPKKTISHFSKSFEEFLEMLGMTFFLILFLRCFMSLTNRIEVSVKGDIIRFTEKKQVQ